jgi:hypothetical protein
VRLGTEAGAARFWFKPEKQSNWIKGNQLEVGDGNSKHLESF